MAELVEVLLRLRGSRQFQSEADRSAKSVGKIGTNAETASKKTGLFGKGIAKLGGAMKYGAAAGGAFAAVAGVKAVNAASDLSEEINKTKTVFGKSGKNVLNWSKDSATAMGQSREEALAAAGQFGNMLGPMGFAEKKSAKMSKQFVGLAGDLASFNNASPEETLAALQSGLSGEAEPLRKFGIFLNDARLKQQAMSMGIYKGKGPLQGQAKALATSALIMKDSKKAQGDFAKTSGGLANQQRILKARVTDLAANIGKKLLPFVLKAVSGINKFIKGMQNGTGAGGKFRKAIQDIGHFITDTLIPGVRDIVGFFKKWVDGFRQGKGGIVAFTAVLAGLAAGILAYKIVVGTITAVTKAWAFAQKLLNAAMKANVLGLIIAGIILLGTALFIAYKKSKTFRDIVNKVWAAVKSAVKWVGTAAVNAFKALWTVLKNTPLIWIIRHFGKIVSVIKSMPGKIAKAASGMWDGIKHAFKSAINWVIQKWNNLSFGMSAKKVAGHTVIPGFHVGTPDIPLLARGGTIARGGSAVVGENGPELIRLPTAAEVIPNRAFAAAAGAGGTHNVVTQVFLDRRQIAEAVGSYTSDRIARR